MKDETLVGDDASFISGGQKQRIALARILYFNREIILLDEFTSNLDKETSREIVNSFIKNYKNKKTIIFATHDLDLANIADKKLKLN